MKNFAIEAKRRLRALTQLKLHHEFKNGGQDLYNRRRLCNVSIDGGVGLASRRYGYSIFSSHV